MSKFTNPEAFQYEAAALLSAGYEAFPGVFSWDYDADDEHYPTTTGKARKDIQFETIRWLVDYGYLDSEMGVIGGKWQALRLTEKALGGT